MDILEMTRLLYPTALCTEPGQAAAISTRSLFVPIVLLPYHLLQTLLLRPILLLLATQGTSIQ